MKHQRLGDGCVIAVQNYGKICCTEVRKGNLCKEWDEWRFREGWSQQPTWKYLAVAGSVSSGMSGLWDGQGVFIPAESQLSGWVLTLHDGKSASCPNSPFSLCQWRFLWILDPVEFLICSRSGETRNNSAPETVRKRGLMCYLTATPAIFKKKTIQRMK